MNRVIRALVATCLLTSSVSAYAEAPVHVYVAKKAKGDHVRYRYRVVNGTAFPIKGLTIGYDRLAQEAQLNFVPLGWSEETGTPATSVTVPAGWSFETIPSEEDSVGMIAWITYDDSKAIVGGQSVAGFEVWLPQPDPPYELGSWTVYMGDGKAAYHTGRLQAEKVESRRARPSR